MSNISTCEAVELVRNAIDPYSMMGISADDMVYASVKRHMYAVEESCRKNEAAVLLNVYGDGVVASVRKAALLDTELAGNQKLAQHLYRDCRDVMRTIVPKPEEM